MFATTRPRRLSGLDRTDRFARMAVDPRSKTLALGLLCICSCTYVPNPNAALDEAGDESEGEMPDGIYCDNVPSAAIGASYTYQPELVMAEPAEVEWGAMNLPAGLTMDPVTGMITGDNINTAISIYKIQNLTN